MKSRSAICIALASAFVLVTSTPGTCYAAATPFAPHAKKEAYRMGGPKTEPGQSEDYECDCGGECSMPMPPPCPEE